MKLDNVGLVYKKNGELAHDVSFRKVDDALRVLSADYGFVYDKIIRDEMTSGFSEDKDLILVLAGDNTLASISQMADVPLLGVNSDMSGSTGFLLKSDPDRFSEHMIALLCGVQGKDYFIGDYSRVESYIETTSGNVIPVNLALNELLVANSAQHHPAKYTLEYRGEKERQSSSGVVLSTPIGSTAWNYDLGGDILDLDKKQVQFVVREDMRNNMTCGMIEEGEAVKITSLGNHNYVVPDAYDNAIQPFPYNSVLTVKVAEDDVQLVSFDAEFRDPAQMERLTGKPYVRRV
ncbi:MAG: NAD(+)/NADH kinase [Candidatus Aenigmarchaeota archaeon]|nr:NAD(+)/NADH kinase [Candidatus Aenigmarchaeota archaeon]